jgi:hypothetical protein
VGSGQNPEVRKKTLTICGAERDRTVGLLNAILVTPARSFETDRRAATYPRERARRSAAQGNVISGNTRNGIDLELGPDQTLVGGNLIGLDASGRTAVPNGVAGISTSQAPHTVVGVFVENGVTLTGGNVISGNGGAGVNLAERDPGTTVAGVFGNLIGLDATGAVGVPNQGDGVHTSIAAQVGDVDRANTIAFNQGAGVVTAGDSNVRFNRIFSNGGLGFGT